MTEYETISLPADDVTVITGNTPSIELVYTGGTLEFLQ